MNLTKEQKMEMVSKAIDAGFKIELYLHSQQGFGYEDLDRILQNFEGVEITNQGLDDSQIAVFYANENRQFEDNFVAKVFL